MQYNYIEEEDENPPVFLSNKKLSLPNGLRNMDYSYEQSTAAGRYPGQMKYSDRILAETEYSFGNSHGLSYDME